MLNYPQLINSVNPLKVYEYLACGLHVVSTKWEQIEDLSEYICLSQTKEEFVKAITKTNNIKFNLKNITWYNKLIQILKEDY